MGKGNTESSSVWRLKKKYPTTWALCADKVRTRKEAYVEA
jgi:hypothetical protein